MSKEQARIGIVDHIAASMDMALPHYRISEYEDMLVAAQEVNDMIFSAPAIVRASEALIGMDLSDKSGRLTAAIAFVSSLKEES